MEKVGERPEIINFLKVDEYPSAFGDGDGSGYGSGDGDGYSDGYSSGYGSGDGPGSGSGSGDGYGSGDGDGSGDGYGYGDGDGDGVEYINGQKVYKIDEVSTLIDSVHVNYARGRILSDDLTTRDCFIAKYGNYFAHGDTLKQAFADAREKYEENAPIEERIARFNQQYPDRDVKVPASELFSWHHILTGSCLMGRKVFCREHNIDYENGSYTINEFISLTRSAFGGNIIKQLESSRP